MLGYVPSVPEILKLLSAQESQEKLFEMHGFEPTLRASDSLGLVWGNNLYIYKHSK